MRICDQLLDDPEYWPKLWSLNPYIRNPHFIWPGMRLRFYSGDVDAPPILTVVKVEETEISTVDEVEKREFDIDALLATQTNVIPDKPVIPPINLLPSIRWNR